MDTFTSACPNCGVEVRLWIEQQEIDADHDQVCTACGKEYPATTWLHNQTTILEEC